MSAPVLRLTGITKRFGEVEVLHGVDFDLLPGEVHALVGENGAGKSTLMKIAAGVYAPDLGRVEMGGKATVFRSPIDAAKAGIGMVHQELSLAPDISVAENIFIGAASAGGPFVGWRELNSRASRMLSDFCLAIDPEEPVSGLGIGYRQVVEILKALAADPKIIIFDEPTSSLEAAETELVLETIRRLADHGIAVVYISHRMDEIFRICDRATVLRDGGLVATRDVKSTTRDEIVSLMVGRQLSDLYPEKTGSVGGELLRVEDLTRDGVFRGIGFTLNSGEILGFSGLVGSGRTEVMRAVFGADRVDSGSVYIDGERRSLRSVRDAMDAGIAYLSEDRKTLGLFLDRSIEDNIMSANLERCSRGAVLQPSLTRGLALEYCDKLGVRARDIDQEAKSLSGGNQQKVLLARWMATNPRVLIVDEPTRGVDVGAKAEIHRMLREYADSGHGVIVVSSEMPEILGLCDRIVVMHEGRVAGTVPGICATEEQLIQLAVG